MGHLEALFLAKCCIHPWQGSVPLLLRLKLGRADLHLPDCSRRGAAADGNLSTLGALPVRELQSREIIRIRGTSELQFCFVFFVFSLTTSVEREMSHSVTCELRDVVMVVLQSCCFFPNQNSFSEDRLCCHFLKWS